CPLRDGRPRLVGPGERERAECQGDEAPLRPGDPGHWPLPARAADLAAAGGQPTSRTPSRAGACPVPSMSWPVAMMVVPVAVLLKATSAVEQGERRRSREGAWLSYPGCLRRSSRNRRGRATHDPGATSCNGLRRDGVSKEAATGAALGGRPGLGSGS